MNSKWTGKDFGITAGISLVYFMITMVVLMSGALTPILWIFMPALIGFFTGIPYLYIVAKEALLEGTTRSFSSRTRAYINQRVCEIAHQTASLYGGSAQVEFRDFAAPLINDNQVVEELTPVAQAVVGKDRVIHNQEKMMQADDFADYLAHVPGCYAFIGSRNSQSCHTGMPHHHAQFDIDEDAMLLSLAVFVGYALQYLA